ncbi:MAG: hypothetical protein R2780_13595 [Crocinitomicaceae bacterium]|nr:hypothetical protein [Crocinitomicaceae bacterium]
MRNIILIILLFQFTAIAQEAAVPFNRLIKVHTGISNEQFENYRLANAINDTASQKFEFLSWSPTLSYTHEIALGQILSVSGNVGFQYMNIYYGSEHYGAPYFYTSLNPQVSVFYRKKFEYYVKLRVGVSVYLHHPDIIPDPARRLLPERVNLFTGVTLGGFNYFFNDRFGLNLEISVWSPELATFGFSYRFFKGELPVIQESKTNNIELQNEQN